MIQRRKILCQFLILGQDFGSSATSVTLVGHDLPKLYLPWSPKIISVFHLFEICGLKIRSFCVKIHWTRRGQNRKFLWTNDFYSKLEYFLENGCLVNVANSSRLAITSEKGKIKPRKWARRRASGLNAQVIFFSVGPDFGFDSDVLN